MNATSDHEPALRKGRDPVWVRILGGALFGLLFGYGGSKLAGQLLPPSLDSADIGLAQAGAMVLAAMSLIVALIIIAMSFSKRLYESENWTAESDASEYQRIVPTLRLTGLALIAMAAEFAALAIPPQQSLALAVIAVIALSLMVQLGTSLRLWQNSDELQRTAIVEGSAASLGVVLVLITVWAPLAMYGFVGFDPVAVILGVTLASIVPTIWISARRGLTK